MTRTHHLAPGLRSVALLAVVLLVSTSAAPASASEPNKDRAIDTSDDPGYLVFTHPEDVVVQGSMTVDPSAGAARVVLDDPAGQIWEVNTDASDFSVYDHSVLDFPFWIQPGTSANTFLMMESDGDIGIGTNTPTARLHMRQPDSRILVQEDSATAARREMFEIRNQGQAAFTIRDTVGGAAGSNTWQFATRGGDAFEINKGGTGGTEFLLRGSGRVTIGPGPNTTFDLSPTGNLTISGTLTQGSSRTIKTGLTAVDPTDALAGIRNLDLWEWSYRGEAAVRHVGPTSEDFHAAFGLGADGTGISTLDGMGVTMAAVQALARENASLRSEVEDLRDLVDELIAGAG